MTAADPRLIQQRTERRRAAYAPLAASIEFGEGRHGRDDLARDASVQRRLNTLEMLDPSQVEQRLLGCGHRDALPRDGLKKSRRGAMHTGVVETEPDVLRNHDLRLL